VNEIIEWRNETIKETKESFKSLENFLEIVPKRKVNKTVVTRLILAGAFDNLEDIEEPVERAELLFRFYDVRKIDAEVCKYLNDDDVQENWKWRIWEKEFTGNGMVDYFSILKATDEKKEFVKDYIDVDVFQDTKFYELTKFNFKKLPTKVVCGHFRDYEERVSKSGKLHFMKLWIDCNSRDVPVTCWGKKGIDWSKVKEKVGKMVYVRGGAAEGWKQENTIYINEECKKKPIIELL
jgi:DNA polymerase III alpha subunit